MLLPGGRGVGPQTNKFEQVSSDHHQLSLVGGRSPGWGRGGLGGRFLGPQMNKFEQVPSDHHQMSLAGGRSPGLMSVEEEERRGREGVIRR